MPVSLIDLLPTFCELAGENGALPYDGQSLIGLLENEPKDRIVFAQAHEAVGVPCLMARQGKYKYNYIHSNEDQLFDVPADPDEWNNLIASEEHSTVAAGMRNEILNRFDPDRMRMKIWRVYTGPPIFI